MKKLGISLLLLTSFVVFSAASCRQPNVATASVSELTIATGIKFDNQPENNVETIAASTEVIYLSGRIENHTRSTNLRVRWIKLPNFVVSTEDFDGRGSSSDKFDYDRTQSVDYFASRVQKEGVAWATGDYRAEVFLDSRQVGTVDFKVVADSEAEAITSRNAISRVVFGSRLTDEGVIARSETSFTPTTDNIHIQLIPGQIKNGANIQVTIKYVKDQVTLNTSNLVFSGEDNLVVSLARSRFGRFWPDGQWAVGVYEVAVQVNSVQAATYTFAVR